MLKRKSKHGADQTIETRDRILHVASDLFASQGFNATTLREITEGAGANLAAVNYYFRSKDELIVSAIEQAVIPLVAARLQALDDCLLNCQPALPTIEQLSTALVEPLLEFNRGGNRNRLLLLMQIRPDPASMHNRVVAKHFKPLHEKFVSALEKVLPHLSRPEIAFRYDCARGATLQSLVELAPARNLASGRNTEKSNLATDKKLKTALVRFVSAGLTAHSE